MTKAAIRALASDAQQNHNGEERRLCLVVDDEPSIRHVLVRLMQADGFECMEAGSGLDAVELLKTHPVILVLTDLRMPHMDGIELLKHVRANHPDVAVVLATGVADVDVAVSCLTIGAMDYLTKPFSSLEDVRARVGQSLEKRKLILENRGYQLRLEERVRQQARRLEDLFLASVQSFAVALEAKDRYTRGHSIRVSRYSTVIANALGLDQETARQIELGGQLHDIGKIGVREEVLNKPGPLTPDEYAHIMTHPVVGWRILSPLLGDAPLALQIVRSHHERFDGRGVPDGLSGTDIPFEARIAAVADAFDAMTSGRPYRGVRMTPSQVVDEMVRNRGSQFDPEVLDVFLECLGKGAIEATPEWDRAYETPASQNAGDDLGVERIT